MVQASAADKAIMRGVMVGSFGRSGAIVPKPARLAMPLRFRRAQNRVMGAPNLGFMRLDLHIEAKMLGHGKDVFVATATHIHDDDMIGGQFGGDLHHMGQGMAGF